MRLLYFLHFFAKLRRVIYSPGLMTKERETVELSLVIPVYNGSRTIGPLVERIQTIFVTTPFEVQKCGQLVQRQGRHIPSSETEGALFFQLQSHESISSQRNHQVSGPVPLHGRFDLPNHAKD